MQIAGTRAPDIALLVLIVRRGCARVTHILPSHEEKSPSPRALLRFAPFVREIFGMLQLTEDVFRNEICMGGAALQAVRVRQGGRGDLTRSISLFAQGRPGPGHQLIVLFVINVHRNLIRYLKRLVKN